LPAGKFWFFLSNWGKIMLLILIFCFLPKFDKLSFEWSHLMSHHKIGEKDNTTGEVSGDVTPCGQ
jgi:hypothetical protein